LLNNNILSYIIYLYGNFKLIPYKKKIMPRYLVFVKLGIFMLLKVTLELYLKEKVL